MIGAPSTLTPVIIPITVPTTPLERTADGTPYSREFGDIYHSAHGGPQQAAHVFLGGNDLPGRWKSRPAFTILETGFGLGVNFLATWEAWRLDPDRCHRLHFVAVERAPFNRADLAAALAPFEPWRDLASALLHAWPPPLRGLHRMAFDGGRVMLTLALGDAESLLPQLVARVDAFFLDGFSPARNPGIWSPAVVRELARLASPQATLATWTVSGGVRTALTDAGFRLQKLPGFATKREMLVGVREGQGEPALPTIDRRAVVVGGGLAGTLVAERLASRDFDVQLVEPRERRSNALVGLVRPVVNLRDALNAQVSRSAFLFALQHFAGLARDGYHLQWSPCGVLQLAEDPEEAARFAAIVASQSAPAEFLAMVDAAEARAIAGHAVRGGGWWFPRGAWVSPESLAVASLARAGRRVRRHTGRAVRSIDRVAGRWRAFAEDDTVIAEAPLMVIANAAGASALWPEARLPLSRVRGQVSYVPASAQRRIEVIVSGSGYAAPLPEGGICLGASYHHDDADDKVRAADHRDNLARADAMLPGFSAGLHPMQLAGWTGFRATVPDRLPVFGESIEPGLHFATGLGSRGLLWAPLGAELIASAVAGEPSPLLRDQAGAISPRRFLS